MSNAYSLRGGKAAVERLELLARVKWPSTSAFVRQAGLRRGMNVLDLGCGIGEVTCRLATIVAPQGHAVGIDRDEAVIEIAKSRHPGAQFYACDASELPLQDRFDFVYIRYLLCHVSSPLAVLHAAREVLKPGGVIAIEDIDFDGHICYPPSHAFDEYVRLFKQVVAGNGGDACIGPRLPDLLRLAGFQEVRTDVVTPLFDRGEGKTVAPITVRHIRESLLTKGLATAPELDDLERQLKEHAHRDDTLMSLSRTFQASALRA